MEINIKVTIELPEWAEALVKQIASNGIQVKSQEDAPSVSIRLKSLEPCFLRNLKEIKAQSRLS